MHELRYTADALIGLRAMLAADRQRMQTKLAALARAPRAPNPNATPLKGGGFRLRVGDWRAIYVIEDRYVTIVVVKIGHRREVYR